MQSGADAVLQACEENVAAQNGRLRSQMAYPKDYKYTKEHEWIQINGNSGTVGITNHAQESLGDIVFVELPKVGTQVQAGKTFGTVESVKAVSDLYAPASGKVVAVND